MTRANIRRNLRTADTQALSARVAGQVVDTFVAMAKRNAYLRAVIDGQTQQYRRTLVWGLLATTGRSALAQASALLAAAHRSMSISASDFELLKYYLLAATERHRLTLDARLKIAAALKSAGAATFARSVTSAPAAVRRNRGHWI